MSLFTRRTIAHTLVLPGKSTNMTTVNVMEAIKTSVGWNSTFLLSSLAMLTLQLWVGAAQWQWLPLQKHMRCWCHRNDDNDNHDNNNAKVWVIAQWQWLRQQSSPLPWYSCCDPPLVVTTLAEATLQLQWWQPWTRDSNKRRRRSILFRMEEEGGACMALTYLPLLAPGVCGHNKAMQGQVPKGCYLLQKKVYFPGVGVVACCCVWTKMLIWTWALGKVFVHCTYCNFFIPVGMLHIAIWIQRCNMDIYLLNQKDIDSKTMLHKKIVICILQQDPYCSQHMYKA